MKKLPGLLINEHSVNRLQLQSSVGDKRRPDLPYHKWYCRPFAALRVLFGKGMVVYFKGDE